MRINHNLSALNAWKNMTVNDGGQTKSLEKLSSGLRIGRAADDAAGLSISEKMRGQISGLNQASRNAQDGISLLQTAEGALQETHSILQRMRELAVQAASDTVTELDRREIQKEINELRVEIDRISTDTEFNTQKLLDGTFAGKTIHIGANADQSLTAGISTMSATALSVGDSKVVFGDAGRELVTTAKGEGTSAESLTVKGTYTGAKVISGIALASAEDKKVTITVSYADGSAADAMTLDEDATAWDFNGLTFTLTNAGSIDKDVTTWDATLTNLHSAGIDVETDGAANDAITTINNAINEVSSERSKLGAIQNRLEHTIANLATSAENLTAAESRIRDVDIAVEMMNFTKYQILSQASTAMLAQANAKPQAVLQLLR
jgi:flagellin